MKKFFLFLLFPEAGFRKEVQEKKISRTKVIYAAVINFGIPFLFLIMGLIIQNNLTLKRNVQVLMDTEVNEQVDNWGRYAPIPFIFVLDRFGMSARSPFVLRAATFVTAYVIGDAVTHRVKKYTHIQRPVARYGNTSFPSQHTNQAFLASMMLHHEYIGSRGGGAVSAVGMLCSGSVGYLRYARDKHWSSDVLVGAAVGMMAVNFVYMFLYGLLKLALSSIYGVMKKSVLRFYRSK